jgi:ATP-dependent Clp protease ATP-binding subunit ClpB
MVRIDMSEYQERHSVSRLVGAPPGYVGYDEGGQLTEKVRRKPYSVVLFDEMEKAHPDVFNILLQVLDDGRLTDNKGRTADFRNTIIIMTSNIGSMLIQDKLKSINNTNREKVLDQTREEVFDLLKKSIRPEFLNRIDEVIMFTPLTEKEIAEIVRLQLKKIEEMLIANDIHLEVTEEAILLIAAEGYDPQYGARPLKRVLQREVLNKLSKMILADEIRKDKKIVIRVKDSKLEFSNM